MSPARSAWATCRLQVYGSGRVPRFVRRWRNPISRLSRRTRDPLLHQARQRDSVPAQVDGRLVSVVMLDLPLPRPVPEVAVIVVAVATHLARRIGREQLVPAAAPDVVERRAGIGRPQRHARVLPEQVEAARRVHEVEDLRAGVGEQGQPEAVALERQPGNTLLHERAIDDGRRHGAAEHTATGCATFAVSHRDPKGTPP